MIVELAGVELVTVVEEGGGASRAGGRTLAGPNLSLRDNLGA